MSKVWISSDTHFCHNRDFLYAPRGFENVQDMNEAIIKNWNERVAYDDEVYLLGDIMLNDNNEGMNCLRRLNGNINIILGNHDTDARAELYETLYNVKVLGYSTVVKINGVRFYLSHYPSLTDNFDYDKPLKARTVNLCGHTHTQDKWHDADKGLIYHCELDAHGCAPILIDDIIIDIQNKIRKER